MEVKARLHNISCGADGKQRVTFTLEHKVDITQLMDKDIRLNAVKWREKRSLDANGLLWHCIDKIAAVLGTDKDSVYLLMLKRYGKFSYVIVADKAVDSMKAMWRDVEEVGKVNVNGREATQLLCYYGSSTYDTKEFSRLLSGVTSEMEQMGIPTPAQEEMDRVLAEWESARKAS